MGTGRKSVTKPFRLTFDEAELLKSKSKEAGMSESAYLRFLISQQPNDYPEIRILLKELINEINHIGVNVNQIAKSNNSGFYSAGDKERLFAYLKKLNLTVDKAVKAFGNQ